MVCCYVLLLFNFFFLADGGAPRPFAGAGIGMSTLSSDRQPFAMA
jgi:hypothetical protein